MSGWKGTQHERAAWTQARAVLATGAPVAQACHRGAQSFLFDGQPDQRGVVRRGRQRGSTCLRLRRTIARPICLAEDHQATGQPHGNTRARQRRRLATLQEAHAPRDLQTIGGQWAQGRFEIPFARQVRRTPHVAHHHARSQHRRNAHAQPEGETVRGRQASAEDVFPRHTETRATTQAQAEAELQLLVVARHPGQSRPQPLEARSQGRAKSERRAEHESTAATGPPHVTSPVVHHQRGGRSGQYAQLPWVELDRRPIRVASHAAAWHLHPAKGGGRNVGGVRA